MGGDDLLCASVYRWQVGRGMSCSAIDRIRGLCNATHRPPQDQQTVVVAVQGCLPVRVRAPLPTPEPILVLLERHPPDLQACIHGSSSRLDRASTGVPEMPTIARRDPADFT